MFKVKALTTPNSQFTIPNSFTIHYSQFTIYYSPSITQKDAFSI